jgi:thiol-disulfide isomerase/thioredoxin
VTPLHHSCSSRCVQNLAPIYEELADAFSHAKEKVVIAKVDADGDGKPLGQKYGVKGFPSAFPYLERCIYVINCNSSEVVRRSRHCVRL